MQVHLYAQCWNDEFTLPFFFRHYDQLVDQYVIYDDGSTDKTLEILSSHPRVRIRQFVRSDADSFVLSEQSLSNECWKESRGTADWVIVTDIDEHLYHRDLSNYLRSMSRTGVTCIPALGFQMISEEAPAPGVTLSDTYTRGAPWAKMMKASIFNPAAIEEIFFTTGRHQANPIGNVRVPDEDELLLLHYKYLGFARTHLRHLELARGLGSKDILNRYGHKYSWTEEEFRQDWENVLLTAVDVALVRDNPSRAYPLVRWWDRYRQNLAT